MQLCNPDTYRLRTPSGKIEIFSETIDSFGYEDCPGHPAWLEPSSPIKAGVAKGSKLLSTNIV